MIHQSTCYFTHTALHGREKRKGKRKKKPRHEITTNVRRQMVNVGAEIWTLEPTAPSYINPLHLLPPSPDITPVVADRNEPVPRGTTLWGSHEAKAFIRGCLPLPPR
jgi:hypothetical protein